MKATKPFKIRVFVLPCFVSFQRLSPNLGLSPLPIRTVKELKPCQKLYHQALGAGVVTIGILGWVCLGVIILGGIGLIWWATERAWGNFS